MKTVDLREKIREIWYGWHDGTPYLHPHELGILTNSYDVLSEDDYASLIKQVDDMKYCQRFHSDRICTLIMKRKLSAPTLANRREHELFRGSIKSKDKSFHAVQFRVFAYGGLVHDFQFKTTPIVVGNNPFIVTYNAKPWADEKKLTEIIDEEEHGVELIGGQ